MQFVNCRVAEEIKSKVIQLNAQKRKVLVNQNRCIRRIYNNALKKTMQDSRRRWKHLNETCLSSNLLNTFHFVFIMLFLGLMKAFPFIFLFAMYIIISWKQVVFSPFLTYCLFLLVKSHSRESFFSKEEIIRSSHIFEFYFFLIFLALAKNP